MAWCAIRESTKGVRVQAHGIEFVEEQAPDNRSVANHATTKGVHQSSRSNRNCCTRKLVTFAIGWQAITWTTKAATSSQVRKV